jgi:hypothetical protein
MLWYFSADSRRWEHILEGDAVPTGRYGHSAVIINDTIYVVGGFSVVGGETLWFEDDRYTTSILDYVRIGYLSCSASILLDNRIILW